MSLDRDQKITCSQTLLDVKIIDCIKQWRNKAAPCNGCIRGYHTNRQFWKFFYISRTQKICKMDGCYEAVYRRGFCKKHYKSIGIKVAPSAKPQ